MHTIITVYSRGGIMAKCWNGSARSEYDAALSAEENHRAAAQKLVDKLNENRAVSWGIHSAAPMPKHGEWAFMIEYVPDVAPLHMSILVRFMPSTNSGPAYMKTHSWLFDKGQRVNYSPAVADGSDIQANARYAAERELERINESVREHGDLIGYALDQYVQLPDGDRLFTLKSGNK